jgi:tetratricopeptide (TPR) repeat protein
MMALNVCNTAQLEEKLSERNRAATYSNRGILYMRAQKHDLAMKDYTDALRILPGSLETKISLGAMYYCLGRFQDSIDALNAAVTIENIEARASAHYNRALA